MPCQFGIREPAARREAQHGCEAPVVVQLAQVEREHALVEVAEQVEGLNVDVGAVQPALQQRPEVLRAVGVDLPIDVALGVVAR